jgi:hypothetical protein
MIDNPVLAQNLEEALIMLSREPFTIRSDEMRKTILDS